MSRDDLAAEGGYGGSGLVPIAPPMISSGLEEFS